MMKPLWTSLGIIQGKPVYGAWSVKLRVYAGRVAKQIVTGEKKSVTVSPKTLESLIGKRKFRYGQAETVNQVGVATGLAYTQVGGDTLQIEVSLSPGKGKFILTGKLGDVMKESAQTALSYVRSKTEEYGIDPKFHETSDIHIHVPEGAIPKDGPSAGDNNRNSSCFCLNKTSSST